jgi:hypothetical protein
MKYRTHVDRHLEEINKYLALKWGIDPHDGPRLWCAREYEKQVLGDCL